MPLRGDVLTNAKSDDGGHEEARCEEGRECVRVVGEVRPPLKSPQ
jgi:hypothetical protein